MRKTRGTGKPTLPGQYLLGSKAEKDYQHFTENIEDDNQYFTLLLEIIKNADNVDNIETTLKNKNQLTKETLEKIPNKYYLKALFYMSLRQAVISSSQHNSLLNNLMMEAKQQYHSNIIKFTYEETIIQPNDPTPKHEQTHIYHYTKNPATNKTQKAACGEHLTTLSKTTEQTLNNQHIQTGYKHPIQTIYENIIALSNKTYLGEIQNTQKFPLPQKTHSICQKCWQNNPEFQKAINKDKQTQLLDRNTIEAQLLENILETLPEFLQKTNKIFFSTTKTNKQLNTEKIEQEYNLWLQKQIDPIISGTLAEHITPEFIEHFADQETQKQYKEKTQHNTQLQQIIKTNIKEQFQLQTTYLLIPNTSPAYLLKRTAYNDFLKKILETF